MFTEILDNVRANTPIVHSITNYVTVNDCANILLACGASPIMADDEAEMDEITAISAALVLNIGTLNQRTIASMLKAGAAAKAHGSPVVLDPVGAGASKLRTDTASRIMSEVRPSVLRGNMSEVKAVAAASGYDPYAAASGRGTQGVDAAATDAVTAETIDRATAFAKELSRRTGAVVAITGAIDIVADAASACIIRNGTKLMSKVTGTGCMLTAIIGAFCAANPGRPRDATAAAVAAMGLCGELAQQKLQAADGTSTYRTLIIDCMSKLDAAALAEGAKIEIR